MPLSFGFRALPWLSLAAPLLLPAAPVTREQALETMKRATTFMVENVAREGGYVWNYLPDLSRRWGELEARPSMIWIQSGTPSMGNCFLDAFHATGDEYYYDAAAAVGDALIAAQHPSGGWNYVADFAGEESLREWYATVGRNAWRLEEFQHFCGNATFDDATTPDAANFMLRLYLEKREARFKASLDRVIQFVLDAQYPSGGWPQRHPDAGGAPGAGCPDYARAITLNDRVGAENVAFLLACHGALGDDRLLDPIRRGMEVFILLQQPAPQAGWALQYTPEDLKPVAARTYEPAALATNATAACIQEMMTFYEMTGDARFLERIPEAFAWLDSVRLRSGAFPTFVEPGTNKPLYLHRAGSNVVNGRYYFDHDPGNLVGHYGSTRTLNVDTLRERFRGLLGRPVARPADGAFLREGVVPRELPRFKGGRGADFNEERLGRIVATLNAGGYWPTPLRFTSHPFTRHGSAGIPPGDYGTGFVGDETDTSPYRDDDPATGISIGSYMGNMGALIRFVEAGR